MDATEQKLKALDSFKDWSNYLLVTTVAALGWTAGKDAGTFCSPSMRPFAIVSFALSIVFGIMTLALVPHIGEDIKAADGITPSIYHVYWSGWFVTLRLTRICLPQHIFFLVGVLLFATGTAFRSPQSWYWFVGISLGSLFVLLALGKPPKAKGSGTLKKN
jgi:hypothetical protein